MSDYLIKNSDFAFPDGIFPPVPNSFPGLPSSPTEKIAKLSNDYQQYIKYNSRELTLNGNSSSEDTQRIFRWAREVLDFAEYNYGLADQIIEASKSIIETIAATRSPFSGPANYILGLWYKFGLFGKPVHTTKSFDFFLQSAQLGYSRSLYRLGSSYEMKGDIKTALIYFEHGLKRGDAACYYRLAMAYLRGHLGKAKDQVIGLRYLENASLLSDPDCPQSAYIYGLIQLGELDGITPSSGTSDKEVTQIELGLRAMERSAWLGFGPALLRMGKAWQNGERGFDSILALRYFHLASRQDQYARYNTSAAAVLGGGELGGVPEVEISKWLLCGSEGLFDSNEEWSFKFAKISALQGNSTGEFAVGYFYEVGIYVSSDLDKAIEWYKLASRHGCQEATSRIQELQGTKGLERRLTRKDHEQSLITRGKGSFNTKRLHAQTHDQLYGDQTLFDNEVYTLKNAQNHSKTQTSTNNSQTDINSQAKTQSQNHPDLHDEAKDTPDLVPEPCVSKSVYGPSSAELAQIKQKKRPKSLALSEQSLIRPIQLPPVTPLTPLSNAFSSSLENKNESGLGVIEEDSSSIKSSTFSKSPSPTRGRHRHSNSVQGNFGSLGNSGMRISPSPRRTSSPVKSTFGSLNTDISNSLPKDNEDVDYNQSEDISSGSCSPSPIKQSITLDDKISDLNISKLRKPCSETELTSSPKSPQKNIAKHVFNIVKKSARRVSGQRRNSGVDDPLVSQSFTKIESEDISAMKDMQSDVPSPCQSLNTSISKVQKSIMNSDNEEEDDDNDDQIERSKYSYPVVPLRVRSSQVSINSQISGQSFESGTEPLNVKNGNDPKISRDTVDKMEMSSTSSKIGSTSIRSLTSLSPSKQNSIILEDSSLKVLPTNSDLVPSPRDTVSKSRSQNSLSSVNTICGELDIPQVRPSSPAESYGNDKEDVRIPRRDTTSPAISSFSRTSTTSSVDSISTSTTSTTWSTILEDNDKVNELKKHQPIKGSPLKHSNTQRSSGVAMTFEEMGIPKTVEEKDDCIVM